MKRRNNLKRVLMAVNVLLILGLVGYSGTLFFENRDLNEQLTQTAEQKRDQLIAEIDEVFDLPDETPEVVIVTDPEQFKTEYTTFDNVQEGDHLLVFRKARLGVLYRQSDKRVVKTTTVVIPITIELIGSQEVLDAAESKLAEFGSQITVSKTFREDVTQTLVFDVDEDQQSEVSSIATQLDYEISSTLPTSIIPASQTEIVILIADPKPAETTP